jgi:hypothetical protein
MAKRKPSNKSKTGEELQDDGTYSLAPPAHSDESAEKKNDDGTFPLVPPVEPTTTIYLARSSARGAVHRSGNPIEEAEAITLRQNGQDVVVCGNDLGVNRRMAGSIEARANGRTVRHPPHISAGEHALPHFQPAIRPPQGHTYYETGRRRAFPS